MKSEGVRRSRDQLSKGFIEKNLLQRMSRSCSNERNEEMQDVDDTYEDSWRVVGSRVMIAQKQEALHRCMAVHIREPRRDVWARMA